MGIYLNPGTDGFVKTINSEIYIDKTGLLNYTNRVINTLRGYICVSRRDALENLLLLPCWLLTIAAIAIPKVVFLPLKLPRAPFLKLI